jgi:hypothetical protein
MTKVFKKMAFCLSGLLGLFILVECARAESAKDLHPLKIVDSSPYQNGDIIFQTSKSSQSKAIQLATKSEYSHMGIVYEIDGQHYVYEAVQPVKLTKLRDWIKRGENSHYVVKRLKDSDQILTKDNLDKMKAWAKDLREKIMTSTLSGRTIKFIAPS